MSIFSDPYVAPSRIRGVYRYLLLSAGKNGESRDRLERLFMPESLQESRETASRDMVRAVINESVKMNLLLDEGDRIRLHPELPDYALKKRTGDDLLHLAIADCIFNKKNDQNHDLGLAIAWFLSFPFNAAPSSWNDVSGDTLTRARKLDLNDARFGQLRDWAIFLGFVWAYRYDSKRILTPDPTKYLKSCLQLNVSLKKNKMYALGEILDQVSKFAPVLDGGFLRDLIEQSNGGREKSHLSSTLSLGLLRLQQDGFIELHYQSDAESLFLEDQGGEFKRYSHLVWKK